jgi:hypothetical protein
MGRGCIQAIRYNKILISPHNIPKGFKELLATFSGEDLAMIENNLDAFPTAFETYDQHEDVLMKLFSYYFNGKAKEWYDNISPREITKSALGEIIHSFNDQFNNIAKSFP